MKKASLFIMSILLILTLVAGCGTSNIIQGQTPKSSEQGSQQAVTYKDGVYTAEGEADDRGWKPVVEVTIENGKIVDVNYDEIQEEDGTQRSADQEYYKNFLEKAGVDVRKAYETLENALIRTQNPYEVDIYTGATSSSNNMKNLAARALEKAQQ